MPLPLTVSCFSKIQIGFTFLVPAYPGSPGKRAIKRVYACMYYIITCVDAAMNGETVVNGDEKQRLASAKEMGTRVPVELNTRTTLAELWINDSSESNWACIMYTEHNFVYSGCVARTGNKMSFDHSTHANTFYSKMSLCRHNIPQINAEHPGTCLNTSPGTRV